MATVNKKPSWSVRHYQVNGAADGQGEAAIYLLVDGNQDSNIRTNKTDPRPEIMFALLIDGGYGPIMLQNLTELMTQRIPLEYCGDSVAAVGKTIKFDAVVITHWDQDHFDSFSVDELNLMNGDATGIDTATGKIRCFKYGADVKGKRTPKTNIFMQWCRSAVGGNPMTGCLSAPTSPKQRSRAPKGTFGSEYGPFQIDFESGRQAEDGAATYANVALGWTKPAEILGWNLFTGRRLSSGNPPGISSLTALLTDNDPWSGPVGAPNAWTGAPGFYIVGSREYLLGFDLSNDFVKLPKGKSSENLPGVADKTGKIKECGNPNSVMCLLVWRTNTPGTTDFSQHRVSLYAGGDAEFVQENTLIPFMRNTVPRIKLVKAGHHGSSAGSSIDFIKQFNPEHWLYSAGRQHGHPTHDVIAYLGAFYANPANQIPNLDKRLHAVCYPYMLARTDDPDWDQTQVEPGCAAPNIHRRFIDTHYPHPQSFVPNAVKDVAIKNFLTGLTTALVAAEGATHSLLPLQARITAIMQASKAAVAQLNENMTTLRGEINGLKSDIKALQRRGRGKNDKDIDTLKKNIATKNIAWQTTSNSRKPRTKLGIQQAWNVLAPWIKAYWDQWSDVQQNAWPMKYFGEVDDPPADQAPPPPRTAGPAAIGTVDKYDNDETDVQATFMAAGAALIPNAYVRVVYIQNPDTDAALTYVTTDGNERIPTLSNRRAYIKAPRKAAKASSFHPHAGLGGPGEGTDVVVGVKRRVRGDDEESTPDDPDTRPQQRLEELILLPNVETELALENPSSQDYEAMLTDWINACDNIDSPDAESAEHGPTASPLSSSADNTIVKLSSSASIDPAPLPTSASFSLITASSTVLATQSSGYLLLSNVTGNAPVARFFNMQFDGYIHLANLITSENINARAVVDPYDTTQIWFNLWLNDDKIAARANLALVPTFSISLVDTTALIGCFNFQLQLSKSLSLGFSSQPSAIKSGFLVDFSNVSKVLSPQGLLISSTTLCLGLESTVGTGSLVLADLFALVGLSTPSVLDGDSQVVLDQSAQNSVWFTPGPDMQTVLRVSFKQSPAKTTGFLKFQLPSTIIQNSRFWGMRVSKYEGWGIVGTDSYAESCVTEGRATVSAQITLDDGSAQPPIWDSFMTTSDQSIELRLQRNSAADESVLMNIVNWAGKVCGVQGFFTGGTGSTDGTNFWNWLKQLTSDLFIREFLIKADHSSGSWLYTQISLTFEVDLTFGTKTSGAKIPMLLKFSRLATSTTSLIQFKGSLWTEVLPQAIHFDHLNPESQMTPYQWPLAATPQYYIYLPNLFTDEAQSNSFPAGFPMYVTMFNIELSSIQFSFSGAMCSQAGPAATEPTTAPINLTDITILGTYVFKQGNVPAACNAHLHASFQLVPRETDPQMDDARVSLDVIYNSGRWVLAGRTQGLNLGALYAMFPESDSDAVMNALEQIWISDFNIVYKYYPATAVDSQNKSKAGTGSDFTVSATILLGPVELDLTFAYGPTEGPGNCLGWQLGASLSPLDDGTTCTVGELFTDVSPDIATALPDIISNLNLTFYKDTTQLDLNIDKATIKNADNTVDVYMIFSLILQAGDLDFEFYQIADSQPAEATAKKHILRITLNKLPSVPGIPLLDEFEQPFDQADLIWSSDDLTRTDVETFINPICVARKVPIIYYQDPRTQGADPAVLDPTPPPAGSPNAPMPQDFVISAGCHFMIIVEESNTPTIILDYPFLQPAPPPAPTSNQLMANSGNTTDQGTMKPLTNSQGPLSINAIGFKYDQSTSEAEIFFDAAIKFGGFNAILKGFGLRFPVSAIGKWDYTNFSLLISGLEVSLVDPPITVAGEFIKEDPDSYFGGLVVGIEPYSFVAGGYYGTATDPVTKQSFKSMFVFLMVNGPIASIEVVSLSGLKAGFGHNSQITLPKVAEVPTWCFLQDTDKDSTTPLKILDAFSGQSPQWIAPANGPMWFAAGVTGQLMNSISLEAVVVVSITTSDLILSVLAEAIATVPLDEPNAAQQLARIDLGIIAQIDFTKGVASIEGQLSPSSFLLNQNCHLTGGFAIYYWFAGSGHEGDWVLSVGGYHPAYSKPAWYPSVVPVGISWQYDGSLSINGSTYLAITPKCFMAGAHMALVYNSGRINASLTAYADFLVNYSPFAFTAGVGAHIAFSYRAGVGCLSHTFNFNFGVDIDVHGPPLAGVIHISVAVVSFDIYFGQSRTVPDPIDWSGFVALLRQNKAGQSNSNDSQNPPETNLLRLSCTGGLQQDPSVPSDQSLATKSTASAKAVWNVDVTTFAWQITMMMPVNALVVNGKPTVDGDFIAVPAKAPDAVSMKPMQIQEDVASKLLVDVKQDNTRDAVYFGLTKVVTQAPAALFSPYDPSTDPFTSPQSASTSPLLDPSNSTTSQWTSLILTTPLPTPSTQVYTLTPSQLLKDVSTFPTDPTGYHPSIAPQPLSAGQQACLTIWAPTASPPTFSLEANTISAQSSHASFMTLSEDVHGVGQSLLPSSWCKLAGAHPHGAYATKLQQILGMVDMGSDSGGGRPRSWLTGDGLQAEFGDSSGGGRAPVMTSGNVVYQPNVIAIP